MGSKIDALKHAHTLKLAHVNMNKTQKKKSLLEEIQKMGSGGYAQGKPIIIVPSHEYPGNINLKNVVSFLKDGKYVEPSKVTFASNDEKYQNSRTFDFKICGEKVTFEVFDTVQGFTPKQWARVVCLFTVGEPFQLKDWPPSEIDQKLDDRKRQEKIVNLFHRVKGFYLHYQDFQEP